MSLGDFVEQLVASLQKQGVSIPFENERPWHEFFYELKTKAERGKPEFLDRLLFDWDGPYPKSQELSEFLHALHWNACIDALNPHFDTITLPDAVAEIWATRSDELDEDVKQFLRHAVERAQQSFRAFEPSESRT